MSGYLSNLLQRTFAPSHTMVQPRLSALFEAPEPQPAWAAQQAWAGGPQRGTESPEVEESGSNERGSMPRLAVPSRVPAESNSLEPSLAAFASTAPDEANVRSPGAVSLKQSEARMHVGAAHAPQREAAAAAGPMNVTPPILFSSSASSGAEKSNASARGQSAIVPQGAGGRERGEPPTGVAASAQAGRPDREASLTKTSSAAASSASASSIGAQRTSPNQSLAAEAFNAFFEEPAAARTRPADGSEAAARDAANHTHAAAEGDDADWSILTALGDAGAPRESHAPLLADRARFAQRPLPLRPVQPQGSGRQEPAPMAPTIEVTIGRIEVRGPLAAEPRRAPASTSQASSLEQYLSRRSGRSRD